MFVILGGNVTNSTISDCNYYGDDDGGLQDLLDCGWDCESDGGAGTREDDGEFVN